ncbi:MAG: adenosylcobalamin-dependent ribonucleoside-diphosphate reductase [Thermomicrobiales bacterium]
MVSPELSEGARHLLAARYLRRDEHGQIVESIDGMFWRVANAIAAADRAFPDYPDTHATAERFHEALSSRRFLPNSPTLINAGTELGQLMACFVLPVPDSLHGIFTALHDAALIQQSGGGTGFSFSRLRPAGDLVQSTRRPASGPVSFIRLFDAMSQVIAGESVRGGANMGVLRVDHPDIQRFISTKRDPGALPHFNLSVGVTDAFLNASRCGEIFTFMNPHSGLAGGDVDASALLDAIAEAAWTTGEPGLLFLDRIERDNPTPALGHLETTNPCGEVPLLPYESCCLGSINVAAFVRETSGQLVLDETGLTATARLAVHFLDNVVEATRYPVPEIESISRANRKIGVGIMGLADLLIELGIPYGSRESIRLAHHVMAIVQRATVDATRSLAAIRGPFPNFGISRFAGHGEPPRRNATVTTIAPTGGISLIAGCSSGIEPLYALAYERPSTELCLGTVGPHPILIETLERLGLADGGLIRDIELSGRIAHRDDLPESVRCLFRTASEIPSREHLAVQAAIQRHVENAVSKTINLPETATACDVRAAFLLARRLGCKGVTIYREGSRPRQALNVLGHCLACVGEDVIPLSRG